MNRSVLATCLALFSVVGWSLTQADAMQNGESCAAPQVGAANCSMAMGCPVACPVVVQQASCAGYAAPSCAGYAAASCSGSYSSHGMSRREQRMARKASKHGHSAATVAYVMQAPAAYNCPYCAQ